jgi:hypothetical protein
MPDDPNRPATKLDLADLRAHVDQRFDQLVEVTRDMLPLIEERISRIERGDPVVLITNIMSTFTLFRNHR